MAIGTITQSKPAYLRVADVARHAGVTPATVRYYSRIGLLHPRREPDNDYRLFTEDDLHRVTFTRQAQALGLTIGDVKEILELIEEGESPCLQVRAMVARRLSAINVQLDELKATDARIRRAMTVWRELSIDEAAGDEFCPLIERIETAAGAAH